MQSNNHQGAAERVSPRPDGGDGLEAAGTPRAETRWAEDAGGELRIEPPKELGWCQAELERQERLLRAMQAELEAARARYAELCERAPIGYCVLDSGGVIREANRAAARLLGCQREALVASALSRHVDAGQDDALRRHLARVLRTGRGQALELRLTRRLDAEPVYLRLVSEASRAEDGTMGCRCALLDITEQRRLVETLHRRERELEHRAHHDALTGLPNRLLLADRLVQAIKRANRDGHSLAVLFIDLDGFKPINDAHGHDLGDELLKEVGKRLTEGLREGDTVARLGGDEFVLVIAPLADAGVAAATVADKVIAALRRPYAVGGQMLSLSCSVGISLYPANGADVEELICKADEAMYQAKQAGRDTFRLYADPLSEADAEHRLFAASLHAPTEDNHLLLLYQPELALPDGDIIGIEALVRWQHPRCGCLPPARILPLADATGLSGALGVWVLRTACNQLLHWQAAGLPDDVMIKINLSAHQLLRPGLVDELEELLWEVSLPPRLLRLEVSEAAIVAGPGEVLETLHRLQQLGVSLALDDFGAGCASLGRLVRLPLAEIKIDPSCISGIGAEGGEGHLTRGIMAMARSMGLRVVAEGVETQGQAGFLVAERCDAAQGYFYAPPLAPEALLRYALKQHAAGPPRAGDGDFGAPSKGGL